MICVAGQVWEGGATVPTDGGDPGGRVRGRAPVRRHGARQPRCAPFTTGNHGDARCHDSN